MGLTQRPSLPIYRICHAASVEHMGLARLEGMWTEALGMASAISHEVVTATHDGIATLRHSFIVVRGEVSYGPVAVENRRIMATPKLHSLRQPSLFTFLCSTPSLS